MKRLVVALMCLFCAGCVSVSVEDLTDTSTEVNLFSKEDMTSIRHVYPGMTVKEVAAIMGDHIRVGYEKDKEQAENFIPIMIKAPYRTEKLELRGKTYNVVYYMTSIQIPDGLIAEDELTPLVFEEDRLQGKGWDYLFKLKSK